MRQYTPVIVALVVVTILILLKNPALRRKAVTDFSNGTAQAARSSSPNGGTGPRSSQRAASPTGPQDELKTASAYMERGGRNYSEKKLQAAVADYTKVIELTSNPNDKIAALCNRGKARRELGEYDAALADFDQVIEKFPPFASAYLDRGGCFFMKLDYQAAIADFDRAIAIHRHFVALPKGLELALAYTDRASAYYQLGDYQVALADVNKAIEVYPQLTPAHELKEKIKKKASASINDPVAQARSRSTPAESAEEYTKKGWALSENDKLVDALVQFTKAIERNPTNPNYYYGRGVANAKFRRFPEALADLNMALALEPRFPAALAERGLVYVEQKQYEQALLDYNKAIELDPNYATAHINKGSLYALQGKWTSAVESLDKGISLGPIAVAYFNRARAHEELGQYQQAISDFQMCLKTSPEERVAEAARERLKNLQDKLQQ